MVKRNWTFRLEDGEHRVDIDHSWWTGKRIVFADGKPVAEESKLLDLMTDYRFKIGGHKGLLTVRSNGFIYVYDFGIDGKSVKTGKLVRRALAMPAWGWLFIVACALIPFVTLGGAVPAGIGVLGAMLCSVIARDATKNVNTRIVICLGVTALCWGAFIAIGFIGGSLGIPRWITGFKTG